MASLAPYKVCMESPGKSEKGKRIVNNIFSLRSSFSACSCPGHAFIYLSDFKNSYFFHKQFSSRQEPCLIFAEVGQVYLYFQMTGPVWPGAHAKVIQHCYCYQVVLKKVGGGLSFTAVHSNELPNTSDLGPCIGSPLSPLTPTCYRLPADLQQNFDIWSAP